MARFPRISSLRNLNNAPIISEVSIGSDGKHFSDPRYPVVLWWLGEVLDQLNDSNGVNQDPKFASGQQTKDNAPKV